MNPRDGQQGGTYMDRMVTKNCIICGKNFAVKERYAAQTKYCSAQCKREAERKRITRHVSTCANCGSLISRYDKPKGENVFCCKQCEIEFRRKEKSEERICPICGNSFICGKLSSQKFCSTTCQNIWQRERNHERSPRYDANFTEEQRVKICPICGRTFRPRNKYYSKRRVYCSAECAKIGIAQTRNSNGDRLSRANTVPQRIANKICEYLRLDYRNEEPCGPFNFDIFLVESELPIEIMGTYWHADVRKYPQIINLQQAKDVIADKRKHTYVCNKLNKEILYLWEDDLIKNPLLCSTLIQQYIKNEGVLPNYHSLNFHLENEACVLNTVLLEPHSEKRDRITTSFSQ